MAFENWEQGTRSRSGARVRSYAGTDKLHERLSCQKNTTQFVGSLSAHLIPIAYDEDVDFEMERKIVMRNGTAGYREARAFAIQSSYYTESAELIVQEAHTNPLSNPMCRDAIRRGVHLYDGTKKSKRALKALQAAVLELRPRFNQKLWKKYKTGAINELKLLRATGLIGGNI